MVLHHLSICLSFSSLPMGLLWLCGVDTILPTYVWCQFELVCDVKGADSWKMFVSKAKNCKSVEMEWMLARA